MDAGWIGGIAGAVIGLAGGIFGTYWGVRGAEGRRERSFAIKCAVGAWLFVLVFLALLILVPSQYGWMVWAVYVPFLVIGILWMNKAQVRIRSEDQQGQATGPEDRES